MANMHIIYTDGGCHNTGDNKGMGAFAWLQSTDLSNEYVDIYGGYVEDSTNNRTEMLAVIEAIRYMHRRDLSYHNIHFISDSGYVVKGYTHPSYLDRWVQNGWKTSTKQPVQNIDLWQELIKLSWHTGIEFELIKGHNKDNNHLHAYWNDIVDKACTHIMQSHKEQNKIFHLKYGIRSKEFIFIGEVN